VLEAQASDMDRIAVGARLNANLDDLGADVRSAAHGACPISMDVSMRLRARDDAALRDGVTRRCDLEGSYARLRREAYTPRDQAANRPGR